MYKSSVCIGPQISRRGNFSSLVPKLYNLSLELTLFYNHYKDYLTLENTYLVDPLALKIHDNDISFEPQESIIEKMDDYKPEYDQKIDVETFYRYYIDDDNYTCKYNCDYRGTYTNVLEHEKTCKCKKGGKHSSKKRSSKKHSKRKKRSKRSKRKKKLKYLIYHRFQ